MSKGGSCDFSELKDFAKKMEHFSKFEIDQLMQSCAKEIAARLLAKVKRRTPTGQYPKKSGVLGGTLRRNWSVGEIEKRGKDYTIEIINPTEYASYVEYGHRKRNNKGWVDGRFMLTISETELQNVAPRLVEQRLKEKLGDLFGE